MFSRLDTIPVCDGRTDTVRRQRPRYAERRVCKNYVLSNFAALMAHKLTTGNKCLADPASWHKSVSHCSAPTAMIVML